MPLWLLLQPFIKTGFGTRGGGPMPRVLAKKNREGRGGGHIPPSPAF